MKLKIKNLGPLTKGGTIDLDRRFYVFVGKNNSGKTYVANVLWSLLEQKRINGEPLFTEEAINTKITLDEKVFEELTSSKNLFKDLWKVFNVKPSFFDDVFLQLKGLYRKFYERKFSFEYIYPIIDKHDYYWNYKIEKNKVGNDLEIKKSKLSHKEYIEWRNTENSDRAYVTSVAYDEDGAFKEFAQKVKSDLFNYLFWNGAYKDPFFLPAHRTFFTSFWKYILIAQKQILDEVSEMRLEGQKNIDSLLKTPYNDSTNDILKSIERLDRKRFQVDIGYSDLLSDLEDLMGGKVNLEQGKEGGIAYGDMKFKLNDSKEELDMYMASSSVNQLTLLYLYFKYWVKEKNNFLIIDEPEENLHPENQVKLMQILANFADRNNNRVLITTHSTLMTDTINNYVRLGYLKDRGVDISEVISQNEHQIADLKELTHKDFGVYYFNGDAIEEYKVGDYGVKFKDFDKVERQIKQASSQLDDLIFDLLNEEE